MATIKDVAEKAGVTVTTVSRVLNNRGYISDATRNKVRLAMEELQYQPNEIARSLMRKRSMMLGLIVPTIAHPFFGQWAYSLETHASARGYKILLCNSRLDEAKEKDYIDMLKSNRVDGIIMGSHTIDVREYIHLGKPIVTFDRRIEAIPCVSSDNYQGGVLAAEHLAAKGCRSIAHICGNLKLDMLGNRRTEGFVDSLRKYGLEPIVVQLGADAFDPAEHEQVVGSLLSEHPEVDGLFVSSDMIAYQVMKVCAAKGIRIPEQLQLIGYDDIPISEWITPGLTTIKQPIEEMSRLAFNIIEKLIEGEGAELPLEHVLPVRLIERQTTRQPGLLG
ncbi:LacI family DNA-binding transcriptional regulator [Paenibacillus hexagrammi]|uniref:LacI family DNA-binding transcriptional regulator n=1 Tax=Paenibacillus hexagrammi TaxID=2908839 RepID=A0ABY3SLS0_9BACL|nr:LacI family DNA-binding transcriptional regulator [Paenibacillus sp. YPD9-1]UJF33897.1 LacI family DNA-binding transcriptional regulator [Paenibacillus sp. YPD9-1]